MDVGLKIFIFNSSTKNWDSEGREGAREGRKDGRSEGGRVGKQTNLDFN